MEDAIKAALGVHFSAPCWTGSPGLVLNVNEKKSSAAFQVTAERHEFHREPNLKDVVRRAGCSKLHTFKFRTHVRRSYGNT